MIKIKYFENEMYHGHICVILGPQNEAIEFLEKDKKFDASVPSILRDRGTDIDGCCITCNRGHILWSNQSLNKSAYSISVLVHEAAHIAFDVANTRGLEYGTEEGNNNEHFAYLIGYLVEKVLDPSGYTSYKKIKGKFGKVKK